METTATYLVANPRTDQPLSKDWINRILERVRHRMIALKSSDIEHFIIHDLRRTLRTNVKPLGLSRDTGEAMLNHKKVGLEEVYDQYDMMMEKREGFARWEAKLVAIARKAGVADALAIPANA